VDEDLTTAPAPRAGLRASLSLLRRNRDFRALFFASVISLGGDWFLWVAINSLIYMATHKALYVGSRSWRRSSPSSSRRRSAACSPTGSTGGS
jgi:hypothetical protein